MSTEDRRPSLRRVVLVALSALLILAGSGAGAFAWRSAVGAQEIVVGVIAAPESQPEALDAGRAVALALSEVDGEIAGQTIRVVELASGGTPESAVDVARRLVEVEGADIVIGPASDAEELALKEYARSTPDVTFVATAASQDLTLRDPVANVFRFTTDAAQWQAGLGAYAFHDLGYRRVAIVGATSELRYLQVGGFMTEFCDAGGHVTDKVWIETGSADWASVAASVPADVNAIFVALDAADTLAFVTAYDASGGTAALIAASDALDLTLVAAAGPTAGRLIGVPTAGPVVAGHLDPAWDAFAAAYQQVTGGSLMPSRLAVQYYTATRATLLALDAVDGDLGDGQERLREALATVTFASPTGPVRLDGRRQAVATNFVTTLDVDANGQPYFKIVRVVANVNQTLGLSEVKFLAQGRFGQESPACP